MLLTRGERFKDAREEHNQHGKQTMKEVEKATGVSASCINDLEDDDKNRNVGYETIAKLAQHYGVPSDFLLGFTESYSLDTNNRLAVDYTGLSTKAVESLHSTSDFYASIISFLVEDSFFFDESHEVYGVIRDICHYVTLPQSRNMLGYYDGNVILVDENGNDVGIVKEESELPYIDTATLDKYFESRYLDQIQKGLRKIREYFNPSVSEDYYPYTQNEDIDNPAEDSTPTQ